jgi:HAD superfamily hydrolase (TIGR01509 family)
MSLSNVRAVLFDWDGTLVDTAEASFRCYVRLFDELGIPFDRETYARTYSPNWYQTFRMLDIPEERWPHADARWLSHFAEEEVALIDGARELLDALHARGVATGIVTSGSRGRVLRELATHRFDFHECVFGCDVQEKKPHPEGLLLCLDRLRVAANEAVYVGDSPEDVAMARAAGVYSIAVPGGYPNREALLASRPDAVAGSLAAVLPVILSRADGEGPPESSGQDASGGGPSPSTRLRMTVDAR